MAQGTVKRSNSDKSYGSIAPGDRAPDVSVHHSAIEADGYRSPRSTSASRRRFPTAGDGAEGD
jgi:cold shock CspA family protein